MRMAESRRSSRARIASRWSSCRRSLMPMSLRIASREQQKRMAARFELGDPDRPKGHALLYFQSADGRGEILATYIVVLPIAINPAKYIPPVFAGRMPPAASVSATALPPIPETMESIAAVRRLAEFRGDDLLDGGVVEPEPERLMLAA